MSALTRRITAALAVAALTVGLAACSSDPLADQYRAGSNKGFIEGSFQVQETAAADRGAPISFQGTTQDGKPVSGSDYAGQVLVVNFWYAACGPCRAEAPTLEKAVSDLAGKNASFLGVNIYDQPETAASFMSTYDITYPSIIAVNDGAVNLAFASAVPLTAVPVTLVLDTQGRVAARIIGQLTDASILTTLVNDAIAGAS
ncbi:TlpA disulfide reductase family protein [Microbacterium sp. SORGH_AS_0888]|uniref:TlpA family protein disulfide reductase n=1 Tax=Microbacterium sp. SORGH_AS_0888 TaxID=3041791 RepID=UPI002786E0B7|nr:TlpA disulfide reductase family protein [Microbacterium sp. SORGH_AS_0888]MDQ1130638.1 thiol-disulfide isomerase/thioredoxin [Microbacterium sp. SORGH_AS_0888]